jgi:hypothetical protein
MRKPVRASLCVALLFIATSTPAVWAREAIRNAGDIFPKRIAKPVYQGRWQPIGKGRLRNGVRYAILPRHNHEAGAGLLLRNDGGFIAERRPGERGLTHLIEHVALLSPTTGSPTDRYHFLNKGLSLSLPAPSAGTTSWSETNYFVSSKTTKPEDLDKLLGLFREVASDLTLRTDAVDEGRTQVVDEMARRKPGNDIYASYIAAVAPGSPTDVINGQNSDDVPTASVATIRALYHRLYRPENMMIVIVGDVSATKMRALITQRFGSWQDVGPAAVHAPVSTFKADRIAPISYASLKESRRGVFMTVVSPLPPVPRTRKRQAQAALMDMVMVRAVNNRLALAHPDSPPNAVGMWIEHGEQGHRLIMLWNNFTGDQWRSAVGELKQLTCNLRTGGFSEPEWSAAKQDVIHDLAASSDTMAEMANVELAKDLSHALAAGRDLIPPDEMLGYAKGWFPAIGTITANRWWNEQWVAGAEHIRVEASELAMVKDPVAAIRTVADNAVLAGCKVRP